MILLARCSADVRQQLAAGLPTAIALAATDAQFADDLQQLPYCGKSFRVYSKPDFIGVQLGGAGEINDRHRRRHVRRHRFRRTPAPR